MSLSLVRKSLAGAVASVVILAVAAAPALAGWGSSGGSSGGWGSGSSGGSSGGWGSSGGSRGSSGGSWGSSGGSSGHVGLFARIHSHWHSHRAHRSHYSSGGSSGGSSGYRVHRSWGSSGGSSGGSGNWGSNGGSSGGSTYYSSPSTSVRYYDSTEIPMDSAVPAQQHAPSSALPGPAESGAIRTSHAFLAVNVPADAKVFVNGNPTTSTGTSRQYVSKGLSDGFHYTYEVRAEVVRNGRVVEETKTIQVRAGETSQLAFNFPTTTTPETSVTLHVPADAKVTLAGNETSTTGTTRVFSTTALEEGQLWSDYKVVVTVERDGRTLTKEHSISLAAGESRSLAFDFDSTKIADAR